MPSVSEIGPLPATVSQASSHADHQGLAESWCAVWGSDTMITHGTVHRLADAASLIARAQPGNVGAVTSSMSPARRVANSSA